MTPAGNQRRREQSKRQIDRNWTNVEKLKNGKVHARETIPLGRSSTRGLQYGTFNFDATTQGGGKKTVTAKSG